jgi:MFS family permease
MPSVTLEEPVVASAPSGAPRARLTGEDGVWAPARRRLSLGLVLTITLVAFESLAISTVMPVVADDLGGLALYGWVFSGFFLGNLFGIVTAGQTADARGTAFPFAVGLGLFSVGLLVGGHAPSMPVLVAARVAQGIGAGAIPAVAYASVGRAYPPLLRPRVFAVFSSAWIIPGLIGPAASSAIAEAATWRAVFLALLPLVVLAAAITLPALTRVVPEVPATSATVPPEAAGAGLDGGSQRAASPAAGSAPASHTPVAVVDQRRTAIVLIAGVAAVFAAAGGPSLPVALVLAGVGVPMAVAAFLRLVPPGTVRLAPGIPAAVLVRGILTFAFFGTDAYVSLTFQEVRDQPTWVAGAALTGATIAWTIAAWVQERLVHTVGPRRLVMAGFAFVGVGVVGMLGAQDLLPVPVAIAVWAVAGFGIGLSYSPLSVTVLGLAAPGREGSASASLQLTDVLGVSLGTGAGGAFVAIGEGQGWATRSALELAFAVTLTVALLGIAAARRLPAALPG